MAKKYWRYADAKNTSTGNMICYICNKKIESGKYKYYETETEYRNAHKQCTINDPKWEAIKRKELKYLKFLERKIAAYKEFRDKWKEDTLDEEIAYMEHCVIKLKAEKLL
jgi:hypothetical protein